MTGAAFSLEILSEEAFSGMVFSNGVSFGYFLTLVGAQLNRVNIKMSKTKMVRVNLKSLLRGLILNHSLSHLFAYGSV